jgi:DEAD/DEAH box helicase domain-containing protein
MSERLEHLLRRWRADARLAGCWVAERELPARPAAWAPFPDGIDARLIAGLERLGVRELYAHQRAAVDAIGEGSDVVVATPTASGKSLCYNLPVFQALLGDPEARALYLYPTKALARDQVEALRQLAAACEAPALGAAVFDGDTPGDHRRRARHARVLATNPDMLHAGILPHHASWASFFAGLRFVVVDELHTCRGFFGANVANVLRRLRRVAAFYGSHPRFIATSATIGNPAELGHRVLGSEPGQLRLIDETGAPAGPRTFLVYNPPVIDRALGLRGSYLHAAKRVTQDLMAAGISPLVFTRSRRAVELLVRYLRDELDGDGSDVRGYRGGYLPDRRREVEALLRQGEARAVVTTSALELGIDIGSLDAVVLAGWPGSRAAAWQRAGRAGRRGLPSLVVLVACSEPIDQYVCADPEYLFGASPEHAQVDADNLAVLVPHVKCAAFELAFTPGEAYASIRPDETHEILGYLAERGLVHADGGAFHWVADAYPAQGVALRGLSEENFTVVDVRDGQVLAEVDYRDAPRQLHPNAIYPLEGRLHQVERLDHAAHKAFVRPVDVDYTTDALTHVKVRVLDVLRHDGPSVAYGDVHLVEKVVGFKKIKLHTHENVGYGEVTLPPFELHTRALWLDPRLPAADTRLGAWRAQWLEGVTRAAYTLKHVGALLVLCEAGDLGRAIGEADGAEPARIYLYDSFPGGAGFAERLYEARTSLLERALLLVERCPCAHGCPGCVGPVAGPGPQAVGAPSARAAVGAPSARAAVAAVLRALLDEVRREGQSTTPRGTPPAWHHGAGGPEARAGLGA